MHYPPALPCLPAVCCLSVFCPCCVSYHLRKRVLRGDMSRYLCCNGDWPCSGRCGEQSAPEFCLGLEVGGWVAGAGCCRRASNSAPRRLHAEQFASGCQRPLWAHPPAHRTPACPQPVPASVPHPTIGHRPLSVLQVICCFGQSVASTRWAIQDEMHLRNTQCDNCECPCPAHTRMHGAQPWASDMHRGRSSAPGGLAARQAHAVQLQNSQVACSAGSSGHSPHPPAAGPPSRHPCRHHRVGG